MKIIAFFCHAKISTKPFRILENYQPYYHLLEKIEFSHSWPVRLTVVALIEFQPTFINILKTSESSAIRNQHNFQSNFNKFVHSSANILALSNGN